MSIRTPLGAAVLTLFASAYACAPKPLPPPPIVAAPPPPPDRRPRPLPPAWTYWEPIDAVVHGTAVAPSLPLAEPDLVVLDGASARWAALSREARAAVLEHGFVVVPRATPAARFGQAYASLAESGVPYVVTLDALFWVAHVARDRALAAAEDAVLAPALATLLGRLEVRLESDSYGAPSDLLVPFSLARGVVSVARSLLSPAYQPPVDLAHVVAAENRLIAAHDGPHPSPVLGVTVDYSQIVPRGDADASAARAAYARAVAWLDSAPFVFSARGEVDGASQSTSAARAHTRAALLVARLVDFNVDIEAAEAWRRWTTVADLVGGASDDVPLRALLDAAEGVKMRDATPRDFVDVAKLDHLRHALRKGHPTTSARVFAPRAAADADVLQALVYPSVGKLSSSDGGVPPESSRDGIRALPRALDVGAWLGSKEARSILRDARDDAYEGYDATLAALAARRPAEALRHDSVYSSSLDALATYLAPSTADPSQPGTSSDAWNRRKLEGALAGWATLRHDSLAFARFPTATAATASGSPSPLVGEGAGGVRVAGLTPAFVEVHPEAIAKLLSLVRQTSRGLRALGAISPSSPTIPILDMADHLLGDALTIALGEAQDIAPDPEMGEVAASLPSRLAALEASLVASRAADASLAIDVHTDLVSARALVEACGDLDDLYVAFREPQTGRLVLALGATATHYEVTEHARERTTDTVWRARLHGPSPPPRADYTRAFTAPPPSTEPLDASASD